MTGYIRVSSFQLGLFVQVPCDGILNNHHNNKPATFYSAKIDHGAEVHGDRSVESYASMQVRHKTCAFTIDSAANGNIAPS
jgi:hypothetical protein